MVFTAKSRLLEDRGYRQEIDHPMTPVIESTEFGAHVRVETRFWHCRAEGALRHFQSFFSGQFLGSSLGEESSLVWFFPIPRRVVYQVLQILQSQFWLAAYRHFWHETALVANFDRLKRLFQNHEPSNTEFF